MNSIAVPFVLLALMLAALGAPAATLTVTNFDDSGPGSLRDTIAVAVSGDTVVFSVSGTITLTSGELEIGRRINIVGPAAPGVTVSGNNSNRVFHIVSGIVSISNLTISNGRASGADSSNHLVPGGSGMGGGILNEATLALTNCTLNKNSAVGGRGFTDIQGGSGGNAAGGAICNLAALTLTSCTLSTNWAEGGNGGNAAGIGGNGGSATGGGLYNQGALTLLNCTLSGNSAGGGNGGSDASAAGGAGGNGSGGGFYNQGALTNVNCTVSGNSVRGGDGGSSLGLFGIGGAGGNGTGAGFFQDGSNGGSSILRNTIIAGNSAVGSSGGAGDLFNGGNGMSLGADVSGSLNSQGHNLVGRTNNSSGWVGTDLTGSLAAPLNPLLGPLQNNGGPTATIALLPGSPAVDKGRSFGLSTDQRGAARPFDKLSIANAVGGDGSDIGAFEVGGLLRITDVRQAANDIRVSFTTDAGNNYALQRRDNVASGAWTTVLNNVPGTGAIVTATNTAAGIVPKGFYRVQSLP